ncbi:MAG: hypothetical protein GY894_04060 [Planctomycetes bacterium]|nr:hypothetical protein [Planctomycetota bacterium]MCP4838521.1 hypothetical protein [Planctomycetota bacterium]
MLLAAATPLQPRWVDLINETPTLLCRRPGEAGAVQPVKILGEVAAGRRNGFPRLAPVGKVMLAVRTPKDLEIGLSAAVLHYFLPDP